MRIARGVQNKVLEGMAMEKTVIVSSRGLEGIGAENGEHVLLADNADDYVACLDQVIRGDHPGIGQRARRRIGEHFNWDENLPEVVYLLAGENWPASTEKKASA
jgi:glycosyltransferase involved in cell wall biosynthesis